MRHTAQNRIQYFDKDEFESGTTVGSAVCNKALYPKTTHSFIHSESKNHLTDLEIITNDIGVQIT